jgi:hypothetical protein
MGMFHPQKYATDFGEVRWFGGLRTETCPMDLILVHIGPV